jgi:glutamate--cysteine ligase
LLVPTRPGIAAPTGYPAAAYTSFALDAHDMMREDERGEYRPFGDWIAAGEWDDARWARHLTTLFPEVRPRGHFEVRSCDAVDPTWYPATVVFLAGLVYDPQAATEARRLDGNSAALLIRAGQCGLTDPTIARTVRDLVHVALAGAQRLPGDYLAREHVERGRDILVGHTCRGRSPADLLSS